MLLVTITMLESKLVLGMVMDILVTMARGKLSPTLLDRSLMVFLLLMPLPLAVLTMLVSSQVSPMAMVLAMPMVSMARERLSLRLMPTPLVRWPMASLYIMPLLLDMLIMLVLLPAMDTDLGMPDMPVTSMARLPVKTEEFKN